MLKFFLICGALAAIGVFTFSTIFPKTAVSWLKQTPIAHRGYFDNDLGVPENSLAAIELAIKKGYAIEFDVMLTGDGHVVVHHDASLVRMTGVDKEVTKTPLAEVRQLKLLMTNQIVPTLKEVLGLVAGQVPLLIEIKKDYQEPAGSLEKEVLRVIKDYQGEFAIISFNPYSLAYVAQHAPTYLRGLDYEPWPEGPGGWPEHAKNPLKVLSEVIYASWHAKPHMLICGHAYLQPWVKKTLRYCQTFVAYTIKSEGDLKEARKYAHNVVFEKLVL